MTNTFLKLCGLALLATMACETPPTPKPGEAKTGAPTDSLPALAGPNDSLSAYLDTLYISADEFRKISPGAPRTKLVFRYTIIGKSLSMKAYSYKGNPLVPDSAKPIFVLQRDASSSILLKSGNDITSLVLRKPQVTVIRAKLDDPSYKTLVFVPVTDATPGSDGFKWKIYYSKETAVTKANAFLSWGLEDSREDLNPAPPRDYGGL